jgi:hypothetical protein
VENAPKQTADPSDPNSPPTMPGQNSYVRFNGSHAKCECEANCCLQCKIVLIIYPIIINPNSMFGRLPDKDPLKQALIEHEQMHIAAMIDKVAKIAKAYSTNRKNDCFNSMIGCNAVAEWVKKNIDNHLQRAIDENFAHRGMGVPEPATLYLPTPRTGTVAPSRIR